MALMFVEENNRMEYALVASLSSLKSTILEGRKHLLLLLESWYL
jgi:hypothetical protein